MTTALVPYSEIKEMASVASKSGLFPGAKNPDTACALMLLAQAEGIHPMSAMRRYHVIEGQPSMRADAMLASHYAAGGTVKWLVSTDTECRAVFTSPASSLEVGWTMDDARRAGFAGKQNWTKYPRQMLRARCISEGVRVTSPGVVVGIYTPEEVADFDRVPQDHSDPESREDIIPPRRVEVKVATMTAPEAAPSGPTVGDLRKGLEVLFPALSASKEHAKTAASKRIEFCSRHAGRTVLRATDLTADEIVAIMQAIDEELAPGARDADEEVAQ